MKLKFTALSDTHNFFPKLSGGDVLLLAGDLTNRGTEEEIAKAGVWILEQKKIFKHVLVIAGNHDKLFQEDRKKAEELLGVKTLQNETVEIEGIKVFGSPYSVQFGDWAFMKPDYQLANIVSTWPLDIDLALVHGPAKDLRDLVNPWDSVGSLAIRYWLDKALDQGQLKMLVCGHIHESFGKEEYRDAIILNVAQAGSFSMPVSVEPSPVDFFFDTITKKISF